MMVRFPGRQSASALNRCPSRRGASRITWWPAWVADPMRSAFFIPVDFPGVRLVGVEAAGDGIETGRHAASLVGRQTRASCTAIAPTCCRTRTGRSLKPTRSPLASTIRESGRSMPGSRTAAVHNTSESPTPKRLRHFMNCAGSRESSPRSGVFTCAGLTRQTRADPVLGPDHSRESFGTRVTRICIRVAEKSGIQF